MLAFPRNFTKSLKISRNFSKYYPGSLNFSPKSLAIRFPKISPNFIKIISYFSYNFSPVLPKIGRKTPQNLHQRFKNLFEESVFHISTKTFLRFLHTSFTISLRLQNTFSKFFQNLYISSF